MVDQVWVSYTRNFGGRVSTPQMSLGDLGSKFQIQGTPSLPQLAVSGYFTLGQAISGPVAGTNFYSVRNVLNWNKGSHTFKFGGIFERAGQNDHIQSTTASAPATINENGAFRFLDRKHRRG